MQEGLLSISSPFLWYNGLVNSQAGGPGGVCMKKQWLAMGLAFCLSALPLPALAVHWMPLGNTDEGSISMDRDSPETADGHLSAGVGKGGLGENRMPRAIPVNCGIGNMT
jgi:hypothetical protein